MSVAPETQGPIEEGVREVIAEELFCPPDQVRPDTELADLPGLDSVKLLRIVTALEGRYDIGIDDERLYGLCLVEDLVHVVESELPGRSPASTP